MNNPAQLLIDGKKLIEDPVHWTTLELARNCYGEPVSALALSACSFCSHGALQRAYQNSKLTSGDIGATALSYLNLAAQQSSQQSIVRLNDSQPHHTVLDMWDIAIDMATNKTERWR